MILPPKFSFQNIITKLGWMTLKSSVVIFQALKPCSLFDLIGLNNLIGLTDLNSPISSKNFLILMA
jgi:hypothetical protein